MPDPKHPSAQSLQQQIEALLFLDGKPLTFRQLANSTKTSPAEVENAVKSLQRVTDEHAGGLSIVVEGSTAQLMTSPAVAAFVTEYLQAEEAGELTRPSMETLTIIAYRGPVAKSEIELIRGVNCSIILRNLQIRGLAEEVGETEAGSPIYRVTTEFLRFLGVSKASDLPNYTELNASTHLNELLSSQHSDDFFHRPATDSPEQSLGGSFEESIDDR